MTRWLALLLFAFALAAPAAAQEPARLGKLPDVLVLTTLKSGEWDEIDDVIGDALDEVETLADDRGIALVRNEVVIYEVMGLKTFRARIGYLLDPEDRTKPGRYGKNFELRKLSGPAWVATDVGGASVARTLRRKVLDEVEKPGVRRLKGVETIEIFYGDMDDNDTKVEVYAPLR